MIEGATRTITDGHGDVPVFCACAFTGRKFMKLLQRSVAVLVACTAMSSSAQDLQSIESQLNAALRAQDERAIQSAVTQAIAALGEQAGMPEVADTYVKPRGRVEPMAEDEAIAGLRLIHEKLPGRKWWHIGLDPTKTRHALREVASAIGAFLIADRSLPGRCDHCLNEARSAGDFLLWAQAEAGTGVFPFPAVRGYTEDAAFRAADRFLERAEREGRLHEVVRNGWAMEDFDNGGLQFDNGECGVALFELFAATNDERYLAGAQRAADWSIQRPLVANWNYNSFSVYLLATAYRVTADPAYLDAAVRKARLGVLPGQLQTGDRAGRWFDPHNARPAYHYIMLRSLVALYDVLPNDDPHRDRICDALMLGLKAPNCEFESLGVPTKDKAMETLLLTRRVLAGDALIAQSCTDSALTVLESLVMEEARGGKFPLAPREWGLFLEDRLRRLSAVSGN